jgi:hypothetical protein
VDRDAAGSIISANILMRRREAGKTVDVETTVISSQEIPGADLQPWTVMK